MKRVHSQLAILKKILVNMQTGQTIFPYEWMFDLENARLALMHIYQEEARSLGYSGSLEVEIPELSYMREGLLRLASLSFFGGIGVTFNVVVNTVREAVRSFQLQMK